MFAKRAGVDLSTSPAWTGENITRQLSVGVAMFDYDGDGRLDLYFATCSTLPPTTARKATNKLYRNLGDGKFRDVSGSRDSTLPAFATASSPATSIMTAIPMSSSAITAERPVSEYGDGTFDEISRSAGIDCRTGRWVGR